MDDRNAGASTWDLMSSHMWRGTAAFSAFLMLSMSVILHSARAGHRQTSASIAKLLAFLIDNVAFCHHGVLDPASCLLLSTAV